MTGLEPAQVTHPRDFKSLASAYFATSAYKKSECPAILVFNTAGRFMKRGAIPAELSDFLYHSIFHHQLVIPYHLAYTNNHAKTGLFDFDYKS